jgi:hypothetical protein
MKGYVGFRLKISFCVRSYFSIEEAPKVFLDVGGGVDLVQRQQRNLRLLYLLLFHGRGHSIHDVNYIFKLESLQMLPRYFH